MGRSDGNSIVDYFPKGGSRVEFADVPTEIAIDAAEAFLCFSVEAYRAAAAMARRAIQAAAYAKGAPGTRLIDQIDWLADQGHITDQMRQVAHGIRLGGNLGAHPDRDGLKDVGEDDAEAVLVFLKEFFLYVYEIPARLDRIGRQFAEGCWPILVTRETGQQRVIEPPEMMGTRRNAWEPDLAQPSQMGTTGTALGCLPCRGSLY